MTNRAYFHPIEYLLDSLWKQGRTPRLQVNTMLDGVDVPAHIKERWGKRLVIDLEAAWPLNPVFTEKAFAVDLAFQGSVYRCTLPWESIYVVLDRESGKGAVIEAHLPNDEKTPEQPRPVHLVMSKHSDWDNKKTDPPKPRKFGVIQGGKKD